MENRRLHRCAVLLAALSLLLVASGTAVTTSEERPYYAVGQAHIWLGAAVALLTIVLAALTRRSSNVWTRRCGWIALAVVVVQAALGFQPLPQPPVMRIAHALLGELFFPLALIIAVCTSHAWSAMPEQAGRSLWLSALTSITPFVVVTQVVLGTLFRHGALGLGPHLLGACAVLICISGLALPVVSSAELRAVHAVGWTLLAIAFLQVLLGFTLLTMQVMEADPQYTILATMIHAGTGSLTLAAAAAMAILIRHASHAGTVSATVLAGSA